MTVAHSLDRLLLTLWLLALGERISKCRLPFVARSVRSIEIDPPDAVAADAIATEGAASRGGRVRPISTPPAAPAESWPHRPVLLLADAETPCGATLRVRSPHADGACPIGVPFEFESGLFQGKMLLRIRDLDNSDGGAVRDGGYFSGRRRSFQICVQGRFKRPVNANDVVFGSEYRRALKLKPPRLMMRPVNALLRRASPGLELDLTSDRPRVLATLLGGLRTVSADEPGSEPEIESHCIPENTRAFGNRFAPSSDKTVHTSSSKRRQFFSNPKAASNFVFDTETVYTFDHYDDIMELSTFQLKLGNIFQYDLTKVVDEPFQLLAKSRKGDGYLWYFELWHEKLASKSRK